MPKSNIEQLLYKCSQVFFDYTQLKPLLSKLDVVKTKTKDKGLLAKIKVYALLSLFTKSEYDKYLKESAKLIKRLKHYKIDTHLGILYLYNGICNNIFGNYSKAFAYEQEAWHIFKKAKNKSAIIFTEISQAAILRDQGLIMQAFDQLLLTANASDQSKEPYLFIQCQFELFVLYIGELNQPKLGEECLKKIKPLIESNKASFKHTLNYYYRCAEVSENKGNYKTALKQLQKLEKIKGNFKNHYFNMAIQLMYGSVNKNLHNVEDALLHFKKSIKHGLQINAKPSVAKCYYYLAEMYIKQKNYKLAKATLKKAENLARESNSHSVLAFVFKYQEQVAELENNIDKAYTIFKARHQLEKENFRTDVKFKAEAIKSFGKLNKKEKVVKELLNELNVKKQELATVNIFLEKKDTLIEHINAYVLNMKKLNSKKKIELDELHFKIKEAQQLDFQQGQLQEKLNEETNNFILSLRAKHKGITLSQARIANLIAKGFTSKEISNVLVTSLRNIEQHRYRMRQKFKLNKGKSLSIYLQAFLNDVNI